LANLPVKFANSDEKSCNLKAEFAASELGQNSVPAALMALGKLGKVTPRQHEFRA
jgi:hypothetical protein